MKENGKGWIVCNFYVICCYGCVVVVVFGVGVVGCVVVGLCLEFCVLFF